MKYLRIAACITLIAGALSVTGCMTEATQERFTQEGNNAQACKIRMLAAREKIAEWKADEAKSRQMSPVSFKDDKMALIGILISQQGNMNIAMLQAFTAKEQSVDTCDKTIIAMVRADAQKVAGLNSSGKTAISWIGGLIGLGILSDNWGPKNYDTGAGGDTWNVSGSRVNSKSGNGQVNSSVSSSGEGLGIANTFGSRDSQAIGGLEPRTLPINGDVTSVETGSLSGENAPITIPPTAETLPAP